MDSGKRVDVRMIAGAALITACVAGAFGLSHIAEERAHPRIGSVTIENSGDGVSIASSSDREATMHVAVSGGGDDFYKAVTPGAGQGHNGRVSLTGLTPHTVYTYKVWFESDRGGRLFDSPVATATFTVDGAARVGGDLAAPLIAANSQ